MSPLRARHRQDRESGQAMVEFALILFPLLLLVVGIIQFGIALNYWLDMQRIANQGARWAVVNVARTATQTPRVVQPLQPDPSGDARQQATSQGLRSSISASTVKYMSRSRRDPGDAGNKVGDARPCPLDPPTSSCSRSWARDDSRLGSRPRPCEWSRSRPTHLRDRPCPCRRRRERGQIVVIFALMIPMLLALSGFVVGIGNWYVHAKHLQTKADAGAFAGGGEWEFPCGTEIDARIEAAARLVRRREQPSGRTGSGYERSLSLELSCPWLRRLVRRRQQPRCPQENLGALQRDVPRRQGHRGQLVPAPSLIPLFPDIKRKARVEIRQGNSFSGLLPIAVRAPEPVSAAVFYNEANGAIKSVRYFVRRTSVSRGRPPGLDDPKPRGQRPQLRFAPGPSTGVAIAISLRGACNTNRLQAPIRRSSPPKLPVSRTGFTDVNTNSATRVAPRRSWTATSPLGATTSIRPPLHSRVRANGRRGVGRRSPHCEVHGVREHRLPVQWVLQLRAGTPVRCEANGEGRHRIKGRESDPRTRPNGCSNQNGEHPGQVLPRAPTDRRLPTRVASVQHCRGDDHELRRPRRSYVHDRSRQASRDSAELAGCFRCDSGQDERHHDCGLPWLQLRRQRRVQRQLPLFLHRRRAYLYVDERAAVWSRDPGCAGSALVPRELASIRAPSAGCRLTPRDIARARTYLGNEAASQPSTGGNSCFFVEMGLKGGLAIDADEEPFVFNDGSGKSQTGAVDCDPVFSGQVRTFAWRPRTGARRSTRGTRSAGRRRAVPGSELPLQRPDVAASS